jgi:transcriptional regulator with XRE-family HTH domain
MKKNSIIKDWLRKNSSPEIEKLVRRNLAISDKVRGILEEEGISQKEFAEQLGKTSSEISKWLSGTHNLTMKSIIKMELILDTDLIHVEKEIKYVYLGKIEGGLKEATDSYTSGYYNKEMPAYAS